MDLGSRLFSVCVMMVCLLGAERCSNGDKINCPCSEIPNLQKSVTEPPLRTCFQINTTFRYNCISGYVRKVGTSNLIRCKQINGVAQWTSPSLECIPDPKRTTTQPPTSTETKGHTDIPHGSIITTTVTADSTSLQMTQSISPSASVTAETDRAEPTSPGLHVVSDHSQEFVRVWESKATDGTTSTSTSTTAEPSNNRTVNPHVYDPELGSTTTALVVFASLVIVCAVIGISFWCYRRRSKNNTPPHTMEEQIPMNHGPSGPAP